MQVIVKSGDLVLSLFTNLETRRYEAFTNSAYIMGR